MLKELLFIFLFRLTSYLFQGDGSVTITLGPDNSVVVGLAPFRLDFLHGGKLVVSANHRGLMNFERHREKRETDVAGMWDESFKTHADTKPNGPGSGGTRGLRLLFDLTFTEILILTFSWY